MSDKQPTSLKDCCFSRIETENVQPHSRLWFLCVECAMWLFWGISVVIGALAVAVSLFVMTQSHYALYEATHENFLTFMIEVLPYLWFAVFILMVGAAIYNFRHTKRGYKYSFLTVIISSVVISFAGGAALQLFGFGYSADTMLGNQMERYMSQEKMEMKMWQQPNDGRLVGVCDSEIVDNRGMVVFTDANGQVWDMQITDLFPRDQKLLQSKKTVRVLGAVVGTSTKHFHACGVFPWMMDKQMTRNELSQERQDFVKKVYDQKHKAQERLALLLDDTFTDSSGKSAPDMGVCAELAAVRRIEATMQ